MLQIEQSNFPKYIKKQQSLQDASAEKENNKKNNNFRIKKWSSRIKNVNTNIQQQMIQKINAQDLNIIGGQMQMGQKKLLNTN